MQRNVSVPVKKGSVDSWYIMNRGKHWQVGMTNRQAAYATGDSDQLDATTTPVPQFFKKWELKKHFLRAL